MRYTDLSIIHAFSPLRGKRDFQTFIGAEFDGVIEGTPESRVHWMGKWIEKADRNERIEKSEKNSFILQLEADLIPILARMEER